MGKISLFLIGSVLLVIASLGYTKTLPPEQLRTLKAKEQQVIAYFSKEGKRVYSKNRSFYYRKLLKVNDDGSFILQDFYSKTDTKQIDPATLMDLKELYAWTTVSIDGTFIHWYQNGQKMQQSFYIKGKIEGPRLTWYQSGAKESESAFKAGKLQGKMIQWYESGSKKSEAFYQAGNPEGEVCYWYESGKPYSKVMYQNGKAEGSVEEWYENGQRKFLGLMIKDKLEGYAKTWYEDGTVESTAYYKDNQLEGLQQKWDKKGQLLYQRKYQQGHILWPPKQT